MIGFAAQQTLGNLFTGLLFGITQPVRIGALAATSATTMQNAPISEMGMSTGGEG